MLKIAHIREEDIKEEVTPKGHVPLYENPVFMANLRREFIREHNARIARKKANQR